MTIAPLRSAFPLAVTAFRRAMPALLVAVGVLGAACGSSSSGITAAVGKAEPGKDVTIFFDRLILEIAQGTVAEPTPIQIQRRLARPAAARSMGGFEFAILPTDVALAQPVTLRFRYTGLALPEGVTEAQLFLATMGPTGLATPIAGSTVLEDENEVTAPLPAFGTVALLAPAGPPPENGTGSLVFLREGAGALDDLWKSDAQGGSAALVTAHTADETLTAPRLSTAASRVAFSETVGGGANFRAWIVGLDGSNRTLVTADGAQEIVNDLSTNGTRLYVTHRAAGSETTDLAFYDLTVGPPFPRTILASTPQVSEREARVSPDGTLLLFLDGESRLWRRSPLPGGSETKITTFAVNSFAWRPDNKRILIERPDNFGGGLAELNPLSTGTLFAKILGTTGGRKPSYSPNGEQLLFELFDSDPSVLRTTIRQISRKGAFASILLGGSPDVFPGRSPASAP
ncbi:MAG: hypothetical protein JNJ88_06295 [Planctomycetes bacterium]|nr:hypothetical protein [Planctomycetota bacterium]